MAGMIKKVLIVEDEIFNRLLLRELLEDIDNDIEVLEADSVDGALNSLSHDVEMVFLDLNLKDKSGETLIYKIREINRNCKIIITSGSDKVKALKDKCDWYLLKPYSDKDIEDIISKFF